MEVKEAPIVLEIRNKVRIHCLGQARGAAMARRGGDFTQPPTDLYFREKTVGSGSFGTVYQGRSKITKEIVAIKVINLETSEDEIEDLMTEVTIMTDVNSKHCVKFFGAFVRKAEIWICMEMCGGGSIADLLKCFTLPENDCATVTKGTFEGLKWLHDNKMIHRDIKGRTIHSIALKTNAYTSQPPTSCSLMRASSSLQTSALQVVYKSSTPSKTIRS